MGDSRGEDNCNLMVFTKIFIDFYAACIECNLKKLMQLLVFGGLLEFAL